MHLFVLDCETATEGIEDCVACTTDGAADEIDTCDTCADGFETTSDSKYCVSEYDVLILSHHKMAVRIFYSRAYILDSDIHLP